MHFLSVSLALISFGAAGLCQWDEGLYQDQLHARSLQARDLHARAYEQGFVAGLEAREAEDLEEFFARDAEELDDLYVREASPLLGMGKKDCDAEQKACEAKCPSMPSKTQKQYQAKYNCPVNCEIKHAECKDGPQHTVGNLLAAPLVSGADKFIGAAVKGALGGH